MSLLWETVKMVVVLGCILTAAVYLIKHGSAKIQPKMTKEDGLLQIVDRLSLGPKTGVMLIKVGSKYYLLGMGEQTVTRLDEIQQDELTLSEELLSKPNEPQGFASVLDRFQQSKSYFDEVKGKWKNQGGQEHER